MMLAEPNCSVLIPSCDKYSDLWIPFFTMFWRNWPDCPYPVYLGSNEEVFEHPKVENILVGPDKDWTSGVRKMVESLDTEYVLIMLEDFFIRKSVNTKRILLFLNVLKDLDGHVLQLRFPKRRPYLVTKKYPEIAELEVGRPYRVSTQPSIWKRDFLLNLLCDTESAWEFEVKGSKRSNSTPHGYYCIFTERPIEWKHHVIEKGKWFRSDAKYFGKKNIGCDFTRRPVMTIGESIIWNTRKCQEIIKVTLFSWTLEMKVRRVVRRLKGIKTDILYFFG